MDHLPVFMALKGRQVVLVGGATPAVPKARMLLKAGAAVTIVAPRLSPELATLIGSHDVEHHARPFAAADVPGAALVIAATGVPSVDAAVSTAAQAANVPVNVVDNPALSTFIVPAIIDRSPVVIGVSSGGASPVLARAVRRAIDRVLPARLGPLARFAAQFRGAVKANIPDPRGRRRFWERVMDGPVAASVLRGDEVAAREQMLKLVNKRADAPSANGTVSLVGAGPGDPELLTLRAHRLLQTADVIVYDRLVSPRVLEYARRDAEQVFVGKQPGNHSHTQRKINDLLLRLAHTGKHVVRLKGGDPSVFARGGEELASLRQAGIAVEVVPGITAATAAAASAGFSLTHRDHAASVTFVTGHSAQDGPAGLGDLDWQALARANHTVAIYMGVAAAPNIAGRLIGHGRSPSTPAVMVENASMPEQRVHAATLEQLGALAAACPSGTPALFIVGEVAADAVATQALTAQWPAAAGWE